MEGCQHERLQKIISKWCKAVVHYNFLLPQNSEVNYSNYLLVVVVADWIERVSESEWSHSRSEWMTPPSIAYRHGVCQWCTVQKSSLQQGVLDTGLLHSMNILSKKKDWGESVYPAVYPPCIWMTQTYIKNIHDEWNLKAKNVGCKFITITLQHLCPLYTHQISTENRVKLKQEIVFSSCSQSSQNENETHTWTGLWSRSKLLANQISTLGFCNIYKGRQPITLVKFVTEWEHNSCADSEF